MTLKLAEYGFGVTVIFVSRQIQGPQIMRINGTSTCIGIYLLPRGAPCPSLSEIFSNLRLDWLAQQGPPAPCANSLAGAHAIPSVDPSGWVGEFCCFCPHCRRGEEALHCHPPPPHHFLTAHEVSLVNQKHTCIKGDG